MFTKLHIQNYKSIHNLEIELGRVNVFIGENGCGKSNILEAVAMASCAAGGRLQNDDLSAKGIRVTRPDMMTTAFEETDNKKSVRVELFHQSGIPTIANLISSNPNDINSSWQHV